MWVRGSQPKSDHMLKKCSATTVLLIDNLKATKFKLLINMKSSLKVQKIVTLLQTLKTKFSKNRLYCRRIRRLGSGHVLLMTTESSWHEFICISEHELMKFCSQSKLSSFSWNQSVQTLAVVSNQLLATPHLDHSHTVTTFLFSFTNLFQQSRAHSHNNSLCGKMLVPNLILHLLHND